MKTLKFLSLGFATLLVLSFLTACEPASVVDEPNGEGTEDTIDVNIDGDGSASAKATGKSNLAFNPKISNGVLVPTGASLASIVLVSSALGGFAARRRKR
jgi:hypothetical protein